MSKIKKINKNIFIVSGILIIVVGFIGFWYYRDRIFSKEILKLEILGQEQAKMGEEIEYTVKYKNNGNFVLENPKLTFELPDNSLTEDDKTRLTQNLKDIYPGGEDFVKFKARLLGKEGDLKVARAWLSYTPKNLSARYESDTTFTTKIDVVPITLTLDLSSKIEKGKEFSYVINYFSNVDYPLENLSIKIDPADGFNFKSSIPSSLDNTEWKLDTLLKSQGGRINISGVILGNQQNNLKLSVKLGMWRAGSFIIIKETTQEVEIIQPLLFISQQVNGFSDYVASPGESLRYEVFLRNLGTTPIENLFVTYRLDNNAFDISTLSSQNGQVRPNDNLIIFDYKQLPLLKKLNSKQEVKLEFTGKLKDNWFVSPSDQNNAQIKNKVEVLDISEEFLTKVNSKIGLSQKAYYSTQNGIENSGPIPPTVDSITTYTMVWQATNYFNDVKNIKVKAILPANVSLSDNIFPEDQASNFSFDSASREIVWVAGSLASGSSASLSFQIAIVPSSFQKGTIADLIGQASIFAEDQFTGAVTKSSALGLDTSLPDDSNNSGGGIVQ
ncbi:MAG: hypothetical protein UR31_C0001G0027 [Parcubacteria group bacterium GW2011_GWA2_33_14]|uniref:DUF11 domain-containing protein n=1 Tax=Candidatus Staskawiczbacteria bacterium RIFCSPHIGHO2_02_FULL_33_16 TaxID=1802204 RepID=A0A1G2HU75_9BACT|nr:MAG: hypothetical protein UR31_C0001G0027 [Parcubacteria group bacterium GW2011_GWA2_33_14]OGZ66072.1 MAG: hypothetical protein A3D34_02730 [Candidatus Staskawiczbacteria bacterium RIFCSPHIGHO2_02_FULL_33_16]OGZ70823.1 MAG: hypothetical protein A2980_02220 [Candidatus Staskawiczbacteria bacterium RIFCSPLOWO2_01_FULL_33_13]